MAPEVPSRWMYIALASLGSNRARASRASQPSKASPPPVALGGWWLSVALPYRNRHEAPVGAPVGCGTAHTGRCPLRSGGWRRLEVLEGARGRPWLPFSGTGTFLQRPPYRAWSPPGHPQVPRPQRGRQTVPRGTGAPNNQLTPFPPSASHLTTHPRIDFFFSLGLDSPSLHPHLPPSPSTLPHPPSCSKHPPAFPQVKSVMDAFHCPRQSITDPGRSQPTLFKTTSIPPHPGSSPPSLKSLPYLSSTEQPLPRNSNLIFA